MAQYWKRWPEVREITSGKRIVLFGCSRDWIPKTLARISKTPEYIVDKVELGVAQSKSSLILLKFLS